MGASALFRRYLITGILILTSILITPALVFCQESFGNLRFLTIAPDARGKSLAGGGSVFSKGAISVYYNPALLATSEDFSAEINEYKPGLYGAYMMNLYFSRKIKKWASVGIGYTSFDHRISDWFGYGYGLDWNDIRDYSLGLWAAFSLDPHNSCGIGIKYIKTHPDSYAYNLSNTGKSSIAYDIGWLTRNHLTKATWQNDEIFYPDLHRLFKVVREKGFAFGVSLTNLGKDLKVKYSDYPDRMPKRLRVAAGYQAIDSEPVGLRLTVDAAKILNNLNDSFSEEWSEVAWAYGLEAAFYYIVDFRFGRLLDRENHQRYNTIGFGLGPEWLRIDYSRVLGDDHWDYYAGDYSFSVNCNISTETFYRD